MLSSREQDVDAVRGLEKANMMLVVATYQRDDHHLSFFALKVVHSSNTKRLTERVFLCHASQSSTLLLVEVIPLTSSVVKISVTYGHLHYFAERASELEELSEIGGQHSYLCRSISTLSYYVADKRGDHVHFESVEVGGIACMICIQPIFRIVMIEPEEALLHTNNSRVGSDVRGVFQSRVESVADQLRDRRVHATLCLKGAIRDFWLSPTRIVD